MYWSNYFIAKERKSISLHTNSFKPITAMSIYKDTIFWNKIFLHIRRRGLCLNCTYSTPFGFIRISDFYPTATGRPIRKLWLHDCKIRHYKRTNRAKNIVAFYYWSHHHRQTLLQTNITALPKLNFSIFRNPVCLKGLTDFGPNCPLCYLLCGLLGMGGRLNCSLFFQNLDLPY